MTDPTTPDVDNGTSDDEIRPDVGRLIGRLQTRVGELVGQNAQLEDIIEQLQERNTAQAAEIARLKLPPERTPPKAAR